MTLFLPELNGNGRHLKSTSVLNIFSELFSFYVERLFMEGFVASSVSVRKLPFSTITGAGQYVRSGRALMLFSGFLPGNYDEQVIPRQFVRLMNRTEEVVLAVAGNSSLIAMDSYKSLSWLQNHLGLEAEIDILPLSDMEYGVSFCRHGYPYKEQVTIGYMIINELGLTYARDESLKIARRDLSVIQPKSISNNMLSDGYVKAGLGVTAALVVALAEFANFIALVSWSFAYLPRLIA